MPKIEITGNNTIELQSNSIKMLQPTQKSTQTQNGNITLLNPFLRKYNHYKFFWGTIRRLKVSFYRRSKALQYLRLGNTTLRFEKLRKIFPIFVCVRWVSLSRPPSSIIYLTNLTCFRFMVFDDWYRLKLFSIFLILMYGIVMNCTLIVRRLLGKVTVSK